MDLVELVYRQHRKHDADVKTVIHIIYKVHVNCELKKTWMWQNCWTYMKFDILIKMMQDVGSFLKKELGFPL